ncbi:MAG: phosphoribosyltransferase [Candidatus Gottesmanbacteria bacterium]|nr:phosphoribosyltransferase [Candidatus Gottesmanbacteria bacterium]
MSKIISDSLKSFKVAYLDAVVRSGAIHVASSIDSRFTLRSGDISWIYVDHGEILCNPENGIPFVRMLYEYLRQEFSPSSTVLVNVDSKASPQEVGALAFHGGYRQILVNADDTTIAEKGINKRVRMPETKPGDQLVIVDDVLTKGTTVAAVVELVRQQLQEEHQFHLIVGMARTPQIAVPLLEDVGVTSISWFIELPDILFRVWSDFSDAQRKGLLVEFPTLQKDLDILKGGVA